MKKLIIAFILFSVILLFTANFLCKNQLSRKKSIYQLKKIKPIKQDGFITIEYDDKIQPLSEEDKSKANNLIEKLYKLDGKVIRFGFINPGGPCIELSKPMKLLVNMGTKIQPVVLKKLKDEEIQREIAIILSHIGNKDCLQSLIDYIPTDKIDNLSEEEKHDFVWGKYMWLVYALWQLTDMELGICHKWGPSYTQKIKDEWQDWLNINYPYLYTSKKPDRSNHGWGKGSINIDIKAKLAHIPTEKYRKNKTLIRFEDIIDWKDTVDYQTMLYEYCYSIIIENIWHKGYWYRYSVRELAQIYDKRALEILNTMISRFDEGYDLHGVIRALENIGDTSSIPYLQRIIKSEYTDYAKMAKRLHDNLKNSIDKRRVKKESYFYYVSNEVFNYNIKIIENCIKNVETGSEGVEINEDGFTVKAIENSNVRKIRIACRVLGASANKKAIPILKKVLTVNLNGVNQTGGSGCGWSGRPDVVALAKIGDFSGIEILKKSLANNDNLEILDDFEQIGLKRYIPLIIPFLEEINIEKRIQAARVIINLLDEGK